MKIMRIKLNTLNDANSLVKLLINTIMILTQYVADMLLMQKSIMGLLSLGIPKEIFIVIHTNNKRCNF